MRKGWVLFFAVALVAALAAPAMADVNLSGFIRVKGYMSNFERYDAGEIIPFSSPGGVGAEKTITSSAPSQGRIHLINTESPSAGYVEERARLRFEAKGENVGAVAFFEIDTRWGDTQYVAARNQGGGLEADSINLETKNLYVWFKPNANANVNVGIQNFTDAYRGLLIGYADFAGVVANYKYDPIDFRFAYGKFKDAEATGSLVKQDSNNDVDFWGLEGHFSPMKDARAGLNFYFVNDHAFPTSHSSAKIYTVGADGSFKVSDPLTLSAFFFYQFGTVKDANPSKPDTDLKGWAADVRADVKAGPGKGFLEALYVSGQDPNSTGNDYKGIMTASSYALAGSFFTSTDMEILLPSIDDINSSVALTYDSANQGLGLIHVGAGYTMPIMDKMMGKIGVGHSRFVKAGKASDSFVGTGIPGSKTMATEINARVNYNLAKGLDVGLTGAYAFLGGAYDVTAADKASGYNDPDNLYNLFARLNYAF